MIEVPSTTAKMVGPQLMAAVMATLPAKAQVDMPKAAMEGAPPRAVEAAIAADRPSQGCWTYPTHTQDLNFSRGLRTEPRGISRAGSTFQK